MTTLTPSAPIHQVGDPPAPERRVRLHAVTADRVLPVVASAAGALGLVWVLYGRVLPFSGVLGFWLCWYVLFLLFYVTVTGMTDGWQIVKDRLASMLMVSAGLLVLVIIFDQIGYTIFKGAPALSHNNFFTQTMALTGPLDPLTSGGVVHAMIGSLEQMAIATVISVPLGLLAALFLAEVGGPMAKPVRSIVEAMTALPEIIAGLFIYASVIITFGLRVSGFAAALALSVMMIPYVTRSAELMIRLVPQNLREASYAVGSSQWRMTLYVVLPTARSGLTTAVVLAMARAIGETAPVLLTAGVTPFLNSNPLHNPQISLPLYIWTYVKFPQPEMVARAFGAGLVLMIMVLVLFTIARVFGGQAPGELTRRQRRRTFQ